MSRIQIPVIRGSIDPHSPRAVVLRAIFGPDIPLRCWSASSVKFSGGRRPCYFADTGLLTPEQLQRLVTFAATVDADAELVTNLGKGDGYPIFAEDVVVSFNGKTLVLQ